MQHWPQLKIKHVFEKRETYNLFHVSTYDFLKDYIEDKNPEDRFGRTALHIAAREGHLTVCKILLEVAKNKSPKDNNGRVPLHMAAREGHLPVCQLLLDAAEDKNPKDDKDVTPYSLALQNGHQEVARVISEMVKYKIIEKQTPQIFKLLKISLPMGPSSCQKILITKSSWAWLTSLLPSLNLI